MGTTYMVKFAPGDKLASTDMNTLKRDTTADIEKVLKAVNMQMSTYINESEISRFNRHDQMDWFAVSPDTAQVVAESLKISEASGGAFDVTVGPLINLWGFGADGTPQKIPSENEIRDVMKRTGYKGISVRLSPPALKKENPEIYCDLSAIAKGFGVDKVVQYLDSKGFPAYLVEIGGEVRAKGKRDGTNPWRVGIASPDGGSALQRVLKLENHSMATSGDYFNYFEKDGVRYSHTIDPTTGRPITHKLASVTVIHPSCMTADAYATAIDVMGPDKGYELAVKARLPVFMIIRSGDKFVIKMTAEFDALD